MKKIDLIWQTRGVVFWLVWVGMAAECLGWGWDATNRILYQTSTADTSRSNIEVSNSPFSITLTLGYVDSNIPFWGPYGNSGKATIWVNGPYAINATEMNQGWTGNYTPGGANIEFSLSSNAILRNSGIQMSGSELGFSNITFTNSGTYHHTATGYISSASSLTSELKKRFGDLTNFYGTVKVGGQGSWVEYQFGTDADGRHELTGVEHGRFQIEIASNSKIWYRAVAGSTYNLTTNFFGAGMLELNGEGAIYNMSKNISTNELKIQNGSTLNMLGNCTATVTGGGGTTQNSVYRVLNPEDGSAKIPTMPNFTGTLAIGKHVRFGVTSSGSIPTNISLLKIDTGGQLWHTGANFDFGKVLQIEGDGSPGEGTGFLQLEKHGAIRAATTSSNVNLGGITSNGNASMMNFTNTVTLTGSAKIGGRSGDDLNSSNQLMVSGNITRSSGLDNTCKLTVGGGYVSGTALSSALILTGNNSYGSTEIEEGKTLQIGYAGQVNGGTTHSGQSGTLGGGTVTVNKNSKLWIVRNNNYTSNDVFVSTDATARFDIFGTGILTLTADSPLYTAILDIKSNATLQLGEGGSTGSIGANIYNYNKLIFNHASAEGVTVAANISFFNAGATLEKKGTGRTILTGTYTYTGSGSVTAGTLQIGSSTGVGLFTATTTLNISSGATVDAYLDTLNATYTGAGSYRVARATLETTAMANAGNYSAITGTLYIGNNVRAEVRNNTTYAPTAGYTLSVEDGGQLWLTQAFDMTRGVTIAGNGWNPIERFGAMRLAAQVTDFNTTATNQVANVAMSNYAGTVTLNAASRIGVRFNDSATAGMISGNIVGGTYTLTVSGGNDSTQQDGTPIASTLILTGTNSYGETILEENKTIQIGYVGQINSGTTHDGTTGTLGSGKVTMNAGSTLRFARTNSYALNIAVEGAVAGLGTLVQAGTGTLTLTGANTYGTTVLSSGTLSVEDGGTLGTGNVEISNGALLRIAHSDTYELSNSVSTSGSGYFSVSNTGPVRLTGMLDVTATNIGTTQAISSTLQIEDGGFLTGSVKLFSGTLAFQHSTDATYTSAIQVSANTSNLANLTDTTVTISGNVSNYSGHVGTLTKTGLGKVILSGTNTYTGATTVSEGVLQFGDVWTTGMTLARDTSVTIEADGTLNLCVNGDSTHSLANTVAGTGKLVKSGTAILVLDDAAKLAGYSGDLEINGGTLAVSVALPTSNVLVNGCTFELTDGGKVNDVTVALGDAQITGGEIGGTLTVNSATGTTAISGGTVNALEVNSGLVEISGGTISSILHNAGELRILVEELENLDLESSTITDVSFDILPVEPGQTAVRISDTLTLNRGAALHISMGDGKLPDAGEYYLFAANRIVGDMIDTGSNFASLTVQTSSGKYTISGADVDRYVTIDALNGQVKFEFEPNMVPEPSTWLLLLLGSLLFGRRVFFHRANSKHPL